MYTVVVPIGTLSLWLSDTKETLRPEVQTNSDVHNCGVST